MKATHRRGVYVHLVDGTYELFRHHFGAPPAQDRAGNPVGALRGVLASILHLLETGATHVGVATDHVVESFRNELWEGYKRGDSIEPELKAQFQPLEDALGALGVVVWPMVEYEADDALASAAARAGEDDQVGRVFVCTPDKDLCQCVREDRIVQFDRRKREVRNAEGVRKRFGVPPESIPDYLALVGDAADGFPGLRGWGAKTAGTVLGRYLKLEAIPRDASVWDVSVRGGKRLARALREGWEEALLFRDLATLRTDVPVFEDVESLRWRGPKPAFETLAEELGAPGLWGRATRAAEERVGSE